MQIMITTTIISIKKLVIMHKVLLLFALIALPTYCFSNDEDTVIYKSSYKNREGGRVYKILKDDNKLYVIGNYTQKFDLSRGSVDLEKEFENDGMGRDGYVVGDNLYVVARTNGIGNKYTKVPDVMLDFEDNISNFEDNKVSLAGIGMLAVGNDFGPAFFDMRRLTKYFQFFVLGTLATKFRPKYEALMSNEVFKATFLLSSFIVLFTLNYDMPSVFHHFLRDVALRYFTTFAIVSFFVSHDNSLQTQSKVNSLINLIGQNSLAIYLIHYFFLPYFRPLPEWFAGLNMVTVHIMSILYTAAITGLCLIFIKFLSNSGVIRKYVLGKK